MAYRMNPVEDVQTRAASRAGPRPQARARQRRDSTLLMDATMKGDMPPLALPKREYMERAKAIWQELGFRRCGRRRLGSAIRSATGAGEWDDAALTRSARPLSRERPDQRESETQRAQARDQISARQGIVKAVKLAAFATARRRARRCRRSSARRCGRRQPCRAIRR